MQVNTLKHKGPRTRTKHYKNTNKRYCVIISEVLLRKRKGEFPVQVMKAYGGKGDIAPLILSLGTILEWSASRLFRFTPYKRGAGTFSTRGYLRPTLELQVL